MPAEAVRRPAWAEISMSALRHNVGVVRQVIGATALCGVVKANGYGHGAVATAKMLVDTGVEGLAVATVDEGIELRDAGLASPILILSEIPAVTLNDALIYALTLTVGSIEGARNIVKEATDIGGRHRVHVKVDTGMGRMGVALSDLDEVIAILAEAPTVVIEGLYSHFSVSESPLADDRAFSEHQLTLFDRAVEVVNARGIFPPVLHVANSGAAIGLPDSRRTMVRAGLALYGYLPDPSLQSVLDQQGLSLRPVMSLRAHVTASRLLDAGERPSYGRRRALATRSCVVTVPFGYADGYPRRFFEAGSYVLIGGKRYPLAGMVTMDQIVVDCGEDRIEVGEPVTLLGAQGDEEITADTWASWSQTISWEVLCGVGARVARIVVD